MCSLCLFVFKKSWMELKDLSFALAPASINWNVRGEKKETNTYWDPLICSASSSSQQLIDEDIINLVYKGAVALRPEEPALQDQ